MTRRSLPELYEELFKALPVNSRLPLSTIATKAKIDRRLVKRLLEVAIMIQEEAPIVKEQIGEKTTAYGKVTRAGRPRKGE